MKTETERVRELRRAILRTLRACQGDAYEGWLSQRSLFNVLRSGEPEGLTMFEVGRACAYLAGKLYVEVRARSESKIEQADRDWRITPAGVDLMDETIPPDPGVEDNRV